MKTTVYMYSVAYIPGFKLDLFDIQTHISSINRQLFYQNAIPWLVPLLTIYSFVHL